MEQWRKIPEFEKYEVSNKGRVRRKHGDKWFILKPYFNRGGYLVVDLRGENVRKQKAVHRLVGLMFISNPYGKKCINHKDNDRTNNDAKNLEWVTPRENYLHCREQGRDVCYGKKRREVIGTDMDTQEERFFDSMRAAEKEGFSATKVSYCCKRGEKFFHHGYTWRYADEKKHNSA